MFLHNLMEEVGTTRVYVLLQHSITVNQSCKIVQTFLNLRGVPKTFIQIKKKFLILHQKNVM